MSCLKILMIGCGLITSAGAAQSASVMVKPGQCVVVGGTEVCASMPTIDNCIEAKAAIKADQLFSCRYDLHPHPETPGLKTYALVRTTINTDGKTTDLIIKNYGITDKEPCEAAAEKKNAQ